jgi:hypothetical protein
VKLVPWNIREFVTIRYLLLFLLSRGFLLCNLAPLVLGHIQRKIYEHFYNGNNEFKLSNWMLVKQGRDKSILDCIKIFRDIKILWFNLIFLKKILLILFLLVCTLILKKS